MFLRGWEGPVRSLALNMRQPPDGPGLWPGGRVSLVLGLKGPQSPDFWHQAPWEVPIGGRPRVRVSN